MNVLVSVVGFHDPVSPSVVDGEETAGPILALVIDEPYDYVCLIANEVTLARAHDTKKAIRERREDIEVDIASIEVSDPLAYVPILQEFRRVLRRLMNLPDAHFSVSVSSGTPSMHACWVLLVASGEFPARILNVRPARYVTSERPLVYEVDFSDTAFPDVQIRATQSASTAGLIKDPDLIRRSLGIVGEHASTVDSVRTCAALAKVRVPSLIIGETGTGKELFARLIHELGKDRRNEPLIVVNCAAIPGDLVESELFGHTKGAFTGATKERVGAFEQANGGTLFLDEIGELPHAAQAKLLRVLQEGEVTRVGESRIRKIDVRVVAATNREITSSSYRRSSEFREDLYHRLNVGVVNLLPLRQRRQDIPILALHFFMKGMEKMGRKRSVTQRALSKLLSYSWPGNIRELKNTVERTLLLHEGTHVDESDIRFLADEEESPVLENIHIPSLGGQFNLPGYLDKIRSQLIAEALARTGGNQSQAAKLLGVTAQAIHKQARK